MCEPCGKLPWSKNPQPNEGRVEEIIYLAHVALGSAVAIELLRVAVCQRVLLIAILGAKTDGDFVCRLEWALDLRDLYE